MAIRLDKAIVRGELENTDPGRVTGRIWLLGRPDPLVLDLEGNAWRDVAGTRITFVNPQPKKQKCASSLQATQRGIVGDITASRKVRQITSSDEELNALLETDQPLPFEWSNSLYIEWFSEVDGRIIIETTACEVHTTDFAFQLDEAEEQAQQFANMNAMRNWLETIIQRPPQEADEDDVIRFGEEYEFVDEEDDSEDGDPFSEESWEASLKQSDRLTDAHMEAIDKYGDDDDSEEKIAYVMGWDHLLDAMAFESETDGPVSGAQAVDEEELEGEEWKMGISTDEEDEDDSWIDSDLPIPGFESQLDEDDLASELEDDDDMPHEHPLKRRARELLIRILKELREERRETSPSSQIADHDDEDEEEDQDSPLDRFLSNTMSISGKLAGALGGRGWAQGIEAGHTLAILKRCLNWSNEALSGLNDLLTDPRWEDQHMLFSEFKRELHTIRDGITDLRREIRDQNPGM